MFLLLAQFSFFAPSFFGHASPAPGRNTIVTPGQTFMCTYLIYKDGSTYLAWKGQGGDNLDAGSTVFSTEAQTVFNTITSGNTVCFEPGDTFSQTVQITIPVSVTIVAYGATIKWTGSAPASNQGMFVNSAASLNINWYGGTCDQNSVLRIACLSIGSMSFGNDPANQLASGTFADLRIINCWSDCLIASHVLNTDLNYRNIFVQKVGGGTTADSVEVDGTRANIWSMTVDDANIVGLSAVTAAYLHDSSWTITVVNSLGGSQTSDIVLQSFTNAGVSSPFFLNDIMNVNGGNMVLGNGNLASGVVAGYDIVLNGNVGFGWQIGTNGGGASSGGERWEHITATGVWQPRGMMFEMNSVQGLTLDMSVDASKITVTGVNGLFYASATNAMDRKNDYVVVQFLKIANYTAQMANGYFWAANTGNQMVANFTIIGGDITEHDCAVATCLLVSTGIGTVKLSIQNVAGYNPQPTSAVTAGASVWTYTDSDGWNEFMYLKTVAGISAWTCNGVSGWAITAGSVCYLTPNQTMAVTWATTAPVFQKQPT